MPCGGINLKISSLSGREGSDAMSCEGVDVGGGTTEGLAARLPVFDAAWEATGLGLAARDP